MSMSSDDNACQDHEQVTGLRVVAEYGWVFLRAVVKEGSFWLDTQGRLFWFKADFDRDAARVRHEGRNS
jgi:hypothetical protein